MVKNRDSHCARCLVRVCENRGGKMSDGPPALDKLPAFCPMKNAPEVIAVSL